jgi:negative regulator of flagellin synthesis FlgM
MNIPGDLQRTQPALETYQTSAPDKAIVVQPAATGQVSDQTHLSAAANIVSQSVSQTDVRTDKVAAVQSALASGNYNVDSSQVASKLIDHMLGGGQ